MQKRFSRNYFVTAAYTWSKYMEAIAFLNATDPIPSRVISSQDRPQRLVAVVGFLALNAPLADCILASHASLKALPVLAMRSTPCATASRRSNA